MKLLLAIALVVLSAGIMTSYGQICYNCDDTTKKSNVQQNQVQLTNKGTIKVGFYTDPEKPNTAGQTKFNLSFLNKDSNLVQQHIDYKVFIKKGADQVFGIPSTHTGQGSVTVPFQFADAGRYQVVVEVDGILFQPIPPETATFTVDVGSASVPEFPSSTGVILVIGIISIIVLSARSRKF